MIPLRGKTEFSTVYFGYLDCLQLPIITIHDPRGTIYAK